MDQSARIIAVAGNPVAHSQSPTIHNAFCQDAQINGVCVRLAADSIDEVLAVARQLEICGMSITAPFKESASTAVDALDEYASALGAANAITFDGDRFSGWNTDGDGVLRSLEHVGVAITGLRCLVIGAGGAAKAAAMALKNAGGIICIANRDQQRAAGVAKLVGGEVIPLGDISSESTLQRFDLIVSCISAPVHLIDEKDLSPRHIVLDAFYASPSPLLTSAQNRGCVVVDPREWLLFQAQTAFSLFTGYDVTLESARAALPSPKQHGNKAIALVGVMGSGKSVVARELTKYGYRAIDLDDAIERHTGTTIAELFKRHGEAQFRALEQRVLEALELDEFTVLACGGGTILDQRNCQFLKEHFTTAWLWSPPSSLADRVGDGRERPLLSLGNPQTVLATLLEQRKMHYARSCDFIVSTENRSPAGTARKIVSELGLLTAHAKQDAVTRNDVIL